MLLVTGCPLPTPLSPASQLPAGPEEKVYSLSVDQKLKVQIADNEAVVYRFDATVTREGLYKFETLGNVDTLCALVQGKGKKERFLVVRDIGGEGENCRIYWAFPPGHYRFKVRVDGRQPFHVALRPVRDGRVLDKRLPQDKSFESRLDRLGDRHRFSFRLRAPRLVQFRVRGKGLLQCVLRKANREWLSAPLYRQPYGSCTVGQWLKSGDYTFELRSDQPGVNYRLAFQQIRMQELPSDKVREGYLQPKLFDIFRLKLDGNHRHIIETYGRQYLSCTLEDVLGHPIVEEKNARNGRNCKITGQFKVGTYYLRVKLRRGNGGVYQVSMRQQDYKEIGSQGKQKITPDFQQPMQLFRIHVKQARLYQIEVKGRKLRCSLNSADNDSQRSLAVMNLSEPNRCLLFANLFEGKYFLQVYPVTREDTPYTLQVIEYKSPKGNILRNKRPRLIGPVSPGFRRAFQFELKQHQLLVLETRGQLDTHCTLFNENNQRIAQDDDDGRDYNCKINRWLPPGRYRMRVKITGRRSGIFWVQRKAQEVPWLPYGKPLTVALKYRKQRLTHLLRVKKAGLFSIRTESKLDTKCSILNQDWSKIADDDDSGTDKNCFLAQFLTPGIYPVQVWLYRKDRGTIQLQVDRLPLNTLQLGKKQLSQLQPPRYTSFFRFQVNQPGLYVVRTFGRLDTKCTLRNEQSRVVGSNDDRGGNDKNCQVVENLSPGLHFLEVRLYKQQRSSGQYAQAYEVLLDVQKTPVRSIKIGTTLPAQMTPQSIGRFRFEVKKPGRYRIETKGFLDPKCTLFTQSFQKIVVNDDSGIGRNCRIVRSLAPGTYEIQIRPATSDRSRSTGSYTVSVTTN